MACMEECRVGAAPMPEQLQELSRRIEKIEKMNQACIDANPIKDIYHRFQMLETHINKLYDAINLDDRITGKDVIDRLCKVEKGYTDIDFSLNHINSIHKRIDYQAECFEISFKDILFKIEDIYKSLRVSDKKSNPHKCPVCDGDGSVSRQLPTEMTVKRESFVMNIVCNSCEGKGIVWG